MKQNEMRNPVENRQQRGLRKRGSFADGCAQNVPKNTALY